MPPTPPPIAASDLIDATLRRSADPTCVVCAGVGAYLSPGKAFEPGHRIVVCICQDPSTGRVPGSVIAHSTTGEGLLAHPHPPTAPPTAPPAA